MGNHQKHISIESATKVLGSREKSNKDWLTPDTWQKTEQKRYLKAKMLNTKSLRLLKQAQVAYKNKDQEGKKSARSDKIWWDASLQSRMSSYKRQNECVL